jgi:hypothetical protein
VLRTTVTCYNYILVYHTEDGRITGRNMWVKILQ